MQESFFHEVQTSKIAGVNKANKLSENIAGMGSWEKFSFRIKSMASGISDSGKKFIKRGFKGNAE